MMKQLTALVLAMLLCLCAAAAYAENVELTTTEDGLTFAMPKDWTNLELDAEDYASGYAFWLVDESGEDTMMLRIEEVDAQTTNEDIAQLMSENEDYGGTRLMTNELGQEMVLYTFADGTIVGYCFVDGEGLLYDFLFLHTDGSAINNDRELLALAEECTAYTLLEEPEAAVEEEPAAASDGIGLETVAITDGPVFARPAGWAEYPLSDSDIANGCLACWVEEGTGRSMLVTASELGNITTAELAEGFAGDEDYAMVRLVTNSRGLDMMLMVHADLTTGGYCFVGEDGWLYHFSFALEGGNMTQDAVLTQLVENCMNAAYFE